MSHSHWIIVGVFLAVAAGCVRTEVTLHSPIQPPIQPEVQPTPEELEQQFLDTLRFLYLGTDPEYINEFFRGFRVEATVDSDTVWCYMDLTNRRIVSFLFVNGKVADIAVTELETNHKKNVL